MDPATLALMASMGLQVLGQVTGNSDQAQAEVQNSKFYGEEAQFAQAAGDRQLEVFHQQSQQFYGGQISSFARAGVDVEGSPLAALENTRVQLDRQERAIEQQTAIEVRRAQLKAGAASDIASMKSDPGNNLLQASGTILTGAAKILPSGSRNSGTVVPTTLDGSGS